MPEVKLLFILALVVLLFLWAGWNTLQQREHLKLSLPGLWQAEEGFCKEAEIDGMLLYVGEGEGSPLVSVKHPCYMIMHRNNEIILEKKLELVVLQPPLPDQPFFKGSVVKGIRILDPEAQAERTEGPLSDTSLDLGEFIPQELEMHLDLSRPSMVWREGETVYARLLKDPSNSQPPTS